MTTDLDLVARLRDVGDCGFFHMDLFPLAAKEIEQLRLDLAQHNGNATAVLQAQHERDCAVEDVKRLLVALQAIVDKYHPDGNPMYLHDIAFEALQGSRPDVGDKP